MIYNFKVILFESDKFRMKVKINADVTFQELHNTLQRSLGIPACLVASFFVSDSYGRKRSEISQLEMGSGKPPCLPMRRTRIADIVSEERPYVTYTYDFFNDRSLFLELTGINMEKNLREPKVRMNGEEARVQLLDEVILDNYSDVIESRQVSPDYGVADDYYEIFGDIEELTL